MKKVLVSPSSFGQCGNEPLELLKKVGYSIIENPFGRKLTEDEIIEIAGDMDGVVAGVESYSKRVIDSLPNLKCISRVGVGIDSIDVKYCEEKEIEVYITPEGPTQAVAELSIALALDLLRRVSVSDRRIRNGIWKKEVGNLISGKKVGIVGFGRIGKRTAGLYKALGCSVSAFDLYPDNDWMNDNGIESLSLNELLASSDIISLHVPKPSDGKALITRDELSIIKKDVLLINLARGGVVNEADLLDFLKVNTNAYAALDVFDVEPYDGPLKKLENVVLTPHLGSYAFESKLQMEIDAVKNLIEFFN
jgi:D-3-phosphoglycerate dehydrogenase